MDNLAHVLHALVATIAVVWNGRGSRRIDAEAALRLQVGAEKVGERPLWVVYRSAPRFVARPCMTLDGISPIPCHLEDFTLEGLRSQLPRGLTRAERQPADEPAVIETWQ